MSSCSGKEFVSEGATADSGGTETGSSGSGSGGGNDSGGSDTAAAGKKTSGGDTSAGTGGTTTAGSDTSGAGAPDAGGSGGTGGGVATGCDCPAGHYCRDSSTDCFDCAELSRLHFSTPERLDTLSDAGITHFPRVGSTNTDLFYHLGAVGVRYTTDASTSAGSPIKGTVQQDGAPLLVKTDVTGAIGLTMLMGFNFVFDRAITVGRRQLLVSEWKNGLGVVEALPAPFNSGKSDFSMAIAPHAGADARGFWMTGPEPTNTTALPTLVTAPFAAGVTPTPVVLNLGTATCTPKDAKAVADLTPWVTDDGKLLVVSTTRVDANCAPAGQGKDIYTALLQPATGQPTAAAVPVSDVNGPGDDVDPSFSADLCDLYFSSNRDGTFALYKAHRR